MPTKTLKIIDFELFFDQKQWINAHENDQKQWINAHENVENQWFWAVFWSNQWINKCQRKRWKFDWTDFKKSAT